jgi:hypothetical protein
VAQGKSLSDETFAHDLMEAVAALPVPAVALASGLALSLPGAVVSVAEREHLMALLRARGSVAPTPAQESLLAAWSVARTPGAAWRKAQTSAGWIVITTLNLQHEARSALAFYGAVVRANTRRVERELHGLG